jgi:hypothetical protein
MQALATKFSRITMVLSLALALLAPQMAYSQTVSVEEDPTALAMAGDLVVARPILLAITIVGTAVFLIALPFSLAGGNTVESAQTLVLGPGEATFVRCLGCKKPGYKKAAYSEG